MELGPPTQFALLPLADPPHTQPPIRADNELEVELDEFAVSYKPQKISPKFGGTVRACFICALLL